MYFWSLGEYGSFQYVKVFRPSVCCSAHHITLFYNDRSVLDDLFYDSRYIYAR